LPAKDIIYTNPAHFRAAPLSAGFALCAPYLIVSDLNSMQMKIVFQLRYMLKSIEYKNDKADVALLSLCLSLKYVHKQILIVISPVDVSKG
jgi:hypothetical protein